MLEAIAMLKIYIRKLSCDFLKLMDFSLPVIAAALMYLFRQAACNILYQVLLNYHF